jgi:hypothetical protein
MGMQQQLCLGGKGDVDVDFRTGGGGGRKVAAVVAVRTRGRRLGRCVEMQEIDFSVNAGLQLSSNLCSIRHLG